MTVRWYAIPFNVAPIANSSGAFDLVHRHFQDHRYNPSGFNIAYSGYLYRGQKLWCGWADVTDAQHAVIAADTLALSFPIDETEPISIADRAKILAFLTRHGMPGSFAPEGSTRGMMVGSLIAFFTARQKGEPL